MKFKMLFILLTALFFGCAPSGQAGEILDASAFKAYMESHPSAQLLDVRTPQEWQGGYIQGAHLVNWFDGQFDVLVEQELAKDKPVLVYCAAGGRSAKAMSKLMKLGYQEVYDLQGGLTAWRNAHYDVAPYEKE